VFPTFPRAANQATDLDLAVGVDLVPNTAHVLNHDSDCVAETSFALRAELLRRASVRVMRMVLMPTYYLAIDGHLALLACSNISAGAV